MEVQLSRSLGAKILAHYFRQLFEAVGMRWTAQNTEDIGIAVRCFTETRSADASPVMPFDFSRPRRATSYETVNYNGGEQ